MKKSIIFTAIFLMLLTTGVWAKTEPTPTSENLNQEQINALTNRIASRVAQLKLVERRGIIGKVTDVTNTNITIADPKGDTRFVDVDEFTKFSSASSTKPSFGISDITKGETIGILGLYNKESRRILARFVEVIRLPEIIHGYVSSIDLKNFSLTVTSETSTQDVDVETTTTTSSYNDSSKLARSGFSKLTEGENVVVIGLYDIKNKDRIIATKIIAFPNIPKNPKIKTSIKPSPSTTITTPTPTAPISRKTSSY